MKHDLKGIRASRALLCMFSVVSGAALSACGSPQGLYIPDPTPGAETSETSVVVEGIRVLNGTGASKTLLLGLLIEAHGDEDQIYDADDFQIQSDTGGLPIGDAYAPAPGTMDSAGFQILFSPVPEVSLLAGGKRRVNVLFEKVPLQFESRSAHFEAILPARLRLTIKDSTQRPMVLTLSDPAALSPTWGGLIDTTVGMWTSLGIRGSQYGPDHSATSADLGVGFGLQGEHWMFVLPVSFRFGTESVPVFPGGFLAEAGMGLGLGYAIPAGGAVIRPLVTYGVNVGFHEALDTSSATQELAFELQFGRRTQAKYPVSSPAATDDLAFYMRTALDVGAADKKQDGIEGIHFGLGITWRTFAM